LPILIDDLRTASSRISKIATLSEARRLGLRTAFLCHSHKDSDLVKGTANKLNENGWNIYVDWADTSMPDNPNRETAQRIQTKIVESHYFLFLATAHSMSSRWCPWELGYADGKKLNENIFIIPTSELSGKWHGNEYLQLYRRIDVASSGELAAWNPGQDRGFYLRGL
jgi:hypothetical protein